MEQLPDAALEIFRDAAKAEGDQVLPRVIDELLSVRRWMREHYAKCRMVAYEGCCLEGQEGCVGR